MSISHAQIRQLLIQEEYLLTDNDLPAQPLQQGSEAGSSSSRNSKNSHKSSQRRAAHHAQPTPSSKAEAEVDGIFTVLRAAHRKLPVFDDARPEPGVGVEQLNYLQTVDPVFAPASRGKKDLKHDPDIPQVRLALERLREAHWKLTAPKCFASLKGIPELQQVLAYTAADVAHYAVDSDTRGAPGSFDVLGTDSASEACVNAGAATGSHFLYDGSSLIGQLAPGLRLCLAAEVATGLLCDSQPLPPDTPEHASALLLFLAAALKQAEQECRPKQELDPEAWLKEHTRYGLQDFLASPSPPALLEQLQLAAMGAAQRCSHNTTTTSSSSSSASCRSGASSSDDEARHAALLEHGAQGSVVLAAMEAAAFIMPSVFFETDSSSSSSSSTDGVSSSSGECGSSNNSTAAGMSSSSGPRAAIGVMWQLLQRLRAAAERQQQGTPHASADVPYVLGFVTLLLDDCAQHNPSTQSQSQDVPAQAARTAADAADARSVADNSSTPAAQACSRVGSMSRHLAADDVAWCVAVLTGAAAILQCVRLSDTGSDSSHDGSSSSSDCSSGGSNHCCCCPIQGGLGQCPIHAALLFTVVEGLYFSVREAAEVQDAAGVRAAVMHQMLSVLQLAQQFQRARTDTAATATAAAVTSESSSSSSSSSDAGRGPGVQQHLHAEVLREQIAAAARMLPDRCAFSSAEALLSLHELQQQHSQGLFCSPEAWFADTFQLAGIRAAAAEAGILAAPTAGACCCCCFWWWYD